METEKTLSPNQEKAIPVLISSATNTEAARILDISEVTLYEWLKNPVFKCKLEVERNAIIEAAIGRLKQNAIKAVDTLVELLSSNAEPIKRGAANDILTHLFKYKEQIEIEQRIEAIEKYYNNEAVDEANKTSCRNSRQNRREYQE